MQSADIDNELMMDGDNLYLEEVFSDRRVGTVRRLTPVHKDGAKDISRDTVYMGQTQVLTSVGALPLSFEIAAGSLDQAVAGFAAAARKAFERTMDDLKELQREAASSIILPETAPPGMMGASGMPGAGAMPPRGKIQLK